jgi:hypothetical protein
LCGYGDAPPPQSLTNDAKSRLQTTVEIMEFHANYVSTGSSVGGDYYQASFTLEEDSDELDSDSPYLLIQRSFEMSDGSCYVETHDERYRGHFFLRRIEFTPARLAIELDRPIDNLICVTFRLGALEFEQASHVIKIISGEIEPDPE